MFILWDIRELFIFSKAHWQFTMNSSVSPTLVLHQNLLRQTKNSFRCYFRTDLIVRPLTFLNQQCFLSWVISTVHKADKIFSWIVKNNIELCSIYQTHQATLVLQCCVRTSRNAVTHDSLYRRLNVRIPEFVLNKY